MCSVSRVTWSGAGCWRKFLFKCGECERTGWNALHPRRVGGSAPPHWLRRKTVLGEPIRARRQPATKTGLVKSHSDFCALARKRAKFRGDPLGKRKDFCRGCDKFFWDLVVFFWEILIKIMFWTFLITYPSNTNRILKKNPGFNEILPKNPIHWQGVLGGKILNRIWKWKI